MQNVSESIAKPLLHGDKAAAARRARLDRNRMLAAVVTVPEPTPAPAAGFSPEDIAQFDMLADRRDWHKSTTKARESARRGIRSIEARVAYQRDTHWSAEAQAETIKLETARGAMLTRIDTGALKRELGSGLAWLVTKEKITPIQALAGQAYGTSFADAGASIRSSLPDSAAPGGGSANKGMPGMLNIATFELELARTCGLLGQRNLIAICDDICGMGFKLSDLPACKSAKGEFRTERALALEERLIIALDLLVRHYTLAPQKEATATG